MVKDTESSFLKVPSVVQIFIAEIIAVWGTTSFIMAVWNTARPGTFGEMSLKGAGNWVWFLLGLFCLGWSLWQIFSPKIKTDVSSTMNIGGFWHTRYSICRSHPSYVLLDAILLVIFGFLYYYAKSIESDSRVYLMMLVFSCVFPLLRLAAWYILGLKNSGPATQNAWKPVAWFVVPVFLVCAGVGIAGVVGEKRRATEIASLPVIDEQSFKDGKSKFAQLAGKDGKETGFVRLRAKQISDGPMKCKNKDNTDFATVLADLGAGGEVLIVGANYSNGGFEELLAKSKDNKGKEIEVIGKLREMPPKSMLEDWKAYCGIETLPPPTGNRWALEMKQP